MATPQQPAPRNRGPDKARQVDILRILDAEANRAAEGLRVIEDYVRFVLDDHHLTGLAKGLRHDLAAALVVVARSDRLAARETQADVGPGASATFEQARGDAADVAAASFGRALQALRSLEEYGKLVDANLATNAERVRYRLYTLERAVGITAAARVALADKRLYVLVDGCESEEAFAKLAEQLVSAGVHVLQLREKRLADAELVQRARRLREITRGSATLFIMNDRADLAVLSDADGAHVGQEELSVKDARRIVGPKKLVGLSTHSLEQAQQAVLDGADYIGVGPTFSSTTKNFSEFVGLELAKQVAAEISLPAYSIGGITLENLPQVVATGIHGVAVGAAIVRAADPGAAATAMLKLFNK